MSTNKPTVLIIGATGSIGNSVVRELTTDSRPETVRVVAAVRDEEKAETFREEGIDTAQLDLNEIDTVRAALTGVDRVFLMTGYTVDMLAQSKAVVDMARKAGVSHIVHLSTIVPEDTDDEHFGWHRYVELYIEDSGIDWTHLRPNVFMNILLGGNVRTNSLVTPTFRERDGDLHGYFGDAQVGWIDPDDIAAVAASVLCTPTAHVGKIHYLASEARSMSEVAVVLTEVVGKPFRAVARSADEFLALALEAGMEPTYARGARHSSLKFGRNEIPGQADVTENLEALVGRKPALWRDFAAKHRDKFLALWKK